jgi:REP element-mobilizing transposase RayT
MKYHPNRSVLFVTFSIEEGLLLLSNPLCVAIIKSCLVAAQKLYPVTISHFIVQSTHLHLILVVENPEDVPKFIGHFKTESAHYLNGLLGRAKRTIWCSGYDSPSVLTLSKTIGRIAYIYTNPVKDNLVSTIDEFPGFSSWKMYQSKQGELTKNWKRLRRTMFRCLTPDSHNLRGYTKEAERLLEESKELESFILKPDAWLEAFNITDTKEKERINARILKAIRYIEMRCERERKRKNQRVMGRTKLLNQAIDLSYRPIRNGRRSTCLSDNVALRVSYLKKFRELRAKARRVLTLWRMGDTSERYPPGLYPPSMPMLANAFAG